MRLCVVIPGEDSRRTAGVRIRYGRIRAHMERAGHEFTLETLEEALAGGGDADVYLLSKCHDVRSSILVRRLRAAGRRVGIDFFDDYYSDHEDSSFVHLREWFRDLTSEADFALCATPNMQTRLRSLAPHLPCHVMNDPAGDWSPADVIASLERKQERFLRTNEVEIGWFGMGDNTYFPLGLEDLGAFAGQLASCRAFGLAPRLRILTNVRALTATRLETVARLPVPTVMEEWSEDGERALIDDSLLCFLPVNGQDFSTVKSLNRAVSILTGGSQVLSAGFPLYADMASLVYRDLAELLNDARLGKLRLRPGTLPDLSDLMERLGSAQQEAHRLLAFLTTIPARKATPWPQERPVLVLHGFRTSGDIQKQCHKLGYLSVKSFGAPQRLPCDVEIRHRDDDDGLDLVLTELAAGRLAARWRSLTYSAQAIGLKSGHVLSLSEADLSDLSITDMASPAESTAERIAVYRGSVIALRDVLFLVFDAPLTFLSEMSSPYWVPEIRPEPSRIEHGR